MIATRNRLDYLCDALDSALEQIGVDLEVIVVDDGSTDGTPAFLAGLSDERVRTLRLDPARGVAQARNEAIGQARGTWIAFLDDDDLWAPHKLTRQLEAARETGAHWVFCDILLISPEGDVARVDVTRDSATILEQLLRHNVVQAGNSTVVVKADRLRDVGGFDAAFNNPWDLWIRLAAQNDVAVVEEPLVAYRRHATSFISGNRERALREARELALKHRGLSEQHGVEFDVAGLDDWLRAERVRGLRSAATIEVRAGRRLAAVALQARALAHSRSRADLRRLVGIASDARRAGEVRKTWTEGVPDWLARRLA